jgi:serine/threonine-protein kinase
VSEGSGQQLFGGYRVLRVLGDGGTGQVVRAHDPEHDRDVVLRILPREWAQDPGYRARFVTAARTAARLTEPHVVPIHRYGELDSRLFLDVRLIEGEDLGSLLRRTGALQPARAVDLVGQVARALDAAHAAGLVHGDVKPSNVLLVGRADGDDLARNTAGEDVAHLAGLGVPRPVGPDGTGSPSGTGYRAPEEVHGPDPDGRADVYSLACVLFELLTGRRPQPATGPADPHEPAVAPSSLRAGLPAELDGVVLRGLARDHDQRWTSAGGMAAAARAALAVSGIEVPRPAERPGAVPGEHPAAVPEPRRRSWLPAGSGLGAALGALVVVLLRRRRTR